MAFGKFRELIEAKKAQEQQEKEQIARDVFQDLDEPEAAPPSPVLESSQPPDERAAEPEKTEEQAEGFPELADANKKSSELPPEETPEPEPEEQAEAEADTCQDSEQEPQEVASGEPEAVPLMFASFEQQEAEQERRRLQAEQERADQAEEKQRKKSENAAKRRESARKAARSRLRLEHAETLSGLLKGVRTAESPSALFLQAVLLTGDLLGQEKLAAQIVEEFFSIHGRGLGNADVLECEIDSIEESRATLEKNLNSNEDLWSENDRKRATWALREMDEKIRQLKERQKLSALS